MKTKAIGKFREKMAAGEPVYGLWCTLESASITEMAVGLGMDWVVIDAEHGHLDWKDIVEHVRATVRSETVALVRISHRDTALTKRVLDIGADGVVIPWCQTRQDVEDAVSDSRFPPEGRRGIGGERATVWGQCFVEHTRDANEHVLVVPMIESPVTDAEMEAICGVEGVETFLFGPADFSSNAGYRGQWEGPGVAERILEHKAIMEKQGKHCGLMVTGNDDLLKRRSQGFQMLGVASDTGLILRSLHESLRVVGKDRTMATSFDPADGKVTHSVLSEPPEDIVPDRQESVVTLETAKAIELKEGITFAPRSGAFNGARGLTAGVVHFEPGASLDWHTHPCSEIITVLEGEFESVVAGRVHRLGPLDTIVIPRWCPHLGRNGSNEKPSHVHLSMATGQIEADPVSRTFERQEMALDSCGVAGFETVRRFRKGETSVDYFNAVLMAGVELSGGYVLFLAGEQWSVTVLDFDASLYVVGGKGVCLIEGERYELRGGAAIMIPRGRIHTMLNESDKPMEMLWVYAHGHPERIILESHCVNKERK
jgi:2-keto-3-deoxy-L-rhamnonate aldolase RhmA/quercetin dioxygenase-like cupin family protein